MHGNEPLFAPAEHWLIGAPVRAQRRQPTRALPALADRWECAAFADWLRKSVF
jgi:hypothetical protein